MSEKFTPQTFDYENINNGNRFEDGDVVGAEAINAPIEAAALLQLLAKNAPIMNELNSRDVRVEIENGTFVFYNLGSAGIRFWSGTSTPSAPKHHDVFLDTDKGELYEYSSITGKWTLVYNFSAGGKLTVDSQLSTTSTNPVQNKVVNAKFTEVSNSLSNKVEKVYNDSITNKVLGVQPNTNTPVLLDMVGGGSGAGLRTYSEYDTYNVGDIVYFPSSPNYYGDLFTPNVDEITAVSPISSTGLVSDSWIALNPYWDFVKTVYPLEGDTPDTGHLEIMIDALGECILQISVTTRTLTEEKVGFYTVYISGYSAVANSAIISKAGLDAELDTTYGYVSLSVKDVFFRYNDTLGTTANIKVLSGNTPNFSLEIMG